MFLNERHVQILRRIDALECELFGLYRRVERLRLDLQREWKALPSGARWTEGEQDKSEYSAAEKGVTG